MIFYLPQLACSSLTDLQSEDAYGSTQHSYVHSSLEEGQADHLSTSFQQSALASNDGQPSYRDRSLAFSAFASQHAEPFTAYTMQSAMKHPEYTRHLPLAGQDTFGGSKAWSSLGFPSEISVGQSAHSASSQAGQPTLREHQALSIPSHNAHSYYANLTSNATSPRGSSVGDLTSCSTFSPAMSREQSNASCASLRGTFDMVRLSSYASNFSELDSASTQELALSTSAPFTSPFSVGERSSVFDHICDAGDSPAPFPCNSAPQSSQSFVGQFQDVNGPVSSQSSSSVSSVQSCEQKGQQRTRVRGTRAIAPKQMHDASVIKQAPHPSQQMTRIQSADGMSRAVALIPKAPYMRPQHPKLKCDQCSDHPEGFRGDHELRRHKDRRHAKTRKMWVTVDSSPDGQFLSKCKACIEGKRYGAYYNAAAHLRRTHFHPRKRGRKAKGEEKRGGKGGGDHPPMDVLKKLWMKEVEDVVPDTPRDDDSCSNSINGDTAPSSDGALSPGDIIDQDHDANDIKPDVSWQKSAQHRLPPTLPAAGFGAIDSYDFDQSSFQAQQPRFNQELTSPDYLNSQDLFQFDVFDYEQDFLTPYMQ